MTEEGKPKITVSFSERKRKRNFYQFKKIFQYYLILVIAMSLLEAILDFEGVVRFGFPEASVDFLVLIASFIALVYFTLPITIRGVFRKRSIAVLRVGIVLLIIQIIALEIFIHAFPGLGSTTYFEFFIISELAYQCTLFFIITRYKFARKFFSIHINNGIRFRKGSDGYVESVERSDFWTTSLQRAIEQKIRGELSEEDFLEAISGLEPAKRELILSMTDGIESRLRRRYRW